MGSASRHFFRIGPSSFTSYHQKWAKVGLLSIGSSIAETYFRLVGPSSNDGGELGGKKDGGDIVFLYYWPRPVLRWPPLEGSGVVFRERSDPVGSDPHHRVWGSRSRAVPLDSLSLGRLQHLRRLSGGAGSIFNLTDLWRCHLHFPSLFSSPLVSVCLRPSPTREVVIYSRNDIISLLLKI